MSNNLNTDSETNEFSKNPTGQYYVMKISDDENNTGDPLSKAQPPIDINEQYRMIGELYSKFDTFYLQYVAITGQLGELIRVSRNRNYDSHAKRSDHIARLINTDLLVYSSTQLKDKLDEIVELVSRLRSGQETIDTKRVVENKMLNRNNANKRQAILPLPFKKTNIEDIYLKLGDKIELTGELTTDSKAKLKCVQKKDDEVRKHDSTDVSSTDLADLDSSESSRVSSWRLTRPANVTGIPKPTNHPFGSARRDGSRIRYSTEHRHCEVRHDYDREQFVPKGQTYADMDDNLQRMIDRFAAQNTTDNMPSSTSVASNRKIKA